MIGGVYLENATGFLPHINRFFLEGATTTTARNKGRCESAPNWGREIMVAVLTCIIQTCM